MGGLAALAIAAAVAFFILRRRNRQKDARLLASVSILLHTDSAMAAEQHAAAATSLALAMHMRPDCMLACCPAAQLAAELGACRMLASHAQTPHWLRS